MTSIQPMCVKLHHSQSEPLTRAQATLVKLGDNERVLNVKCQQISTKIKEQGRKEIT